MSGDIVESWPLEHSEKKLVGVHSPDVCEGQPCTVHSRTDHPMRSFSQHWRSDRGIMERICPHGVGHPDPDSPWPEGSSQWIHGCDGCCQASVIADALDGMLWDE